MSTVYINMNRKLLKKGGRKAVKISQLELLDHLRKAIEKGDSSEMEDIIGDFRDDHNLDKDDKIDEEQLNNYLLKYGLSIYAIREGCSKVDSDLNKVVFDMENNESEKDQYFGPKDNLMGVNTLDNGLTFAGFYAGGDWEYPLFFIVYYDGKSLRGYIPSYGNNYNVDFNTAFGSEEECDNYDEVVAKKYKGVPCDDFLEYYIKREGGDPKGEIDFNWDAIKEDIENRIIVS